MSEYSIGSVKVVTNSATVIADSTAPNVPNFLINAAVGDLFKRRYEKVWYQVSSVAATAFTISPAYAGTSGTGLSYLIVRDFTPNLNLPEQSSGDFDTADIYTRAMRKIDAYLPESVTTWIQDTSPPIRVSATAFTASGDYRTLYVTNRTIKVRGNTAAASQNYYSVVATDSYYNATTGKTLVRTESPCVSATPTRYYYAAAINILDDQIKKSHIDWGIGSTQVDASDIPLRDTLGLVSSTSVEGAITELKKNFLTFGNITATVDRNWVVTASKCTRASHDVFNASGNRVTLFSINRAFKVTATVNASYYSYVATHSHYNATTNLTRVTLASQTLPATPIKFYTDTGNTATSFKLTGISQYPDNFFNNQYYINVNTGSNIGLTRQIKDWTATSRVVTATTKFTYRPSFNTRVEFYNSLSNLNTVTLSATTGFTANLVASFAGVGGTAARMLRVTSIGATPMYVKVYTR